ncbi:MAG: 30S ribosomal protein S16 [Candidatus Hodgkinia cicadicola]
MVRIRLVPKRESKHIVVADSRRARDAKAIDKLGIVSTKRGLPCVSIDIVALRSWLKAGALPTRSVAKILANAGLL